MVQDVRLSSTPETRTGEHCNLTHGSVPPAVVPSALTLH